MTDATICAGFDEGGTDTCQGDSGGPLYVRSRIGEPVQAGVVSWGLGCAQRRYYGIYASVAHFEQWIRQHVPNASFVGATMPDPGQQQPQGPAATDQALATYVGDTAAAPPSQLAQINVDVLPGQKVRVGDRIMVRVTSSVAGNVIVYNQDIDGRAYQIFPNMRSGRDLPGQARTTISSGVVIPIPGPTDGFALRITPPTGLNRLIAVVVPPSVRIDDIARKHEDMRSFDNVDSLLEEITRREQQARAERGIAVEEAAPRHRAVGVRVYEIVQ